MLTAAHPSSLPGRRQRRSDARNWMSVRSRRIFVCMSVEDLVLVSANEERQWIVFDLVGQDGKEVYPSVGV